MPADRPILFSAPMIQALLAGKKTQTRRLAYEKPRVGIQIGDGPVEPIMVKSRWQQVRPGDRLWVRETWCPANSDDGPVLLLQADDSRRYLNRESYPVDYSRYSGTGRAAWSAWAPDVEAGHVKDWRPSIHMPRWASRLTLLVTDVRVQRLRDITEADAKAEGVEPVLVPPDGGSCPHVFGFLNLWDQLHGPGGWEANPEVVALTFEVKQRNIDDWELTDG